MRLFVGLGNPGAKFAGNRHNIGFMALDRVAADHKLSPWRARFQGHVAEGTLGGAKALLLKPGTFMNLSGQSVSEAMRFYKLAPTDVLVFHDEIDLAPGKLRLKSGGGHAGHNGLRSIHQHIGADYRRIRMGVGHPGHKDAVAGHVLRDFASQEADWLDDMLRGVSDGIGHLAAGEDDRFLNAVALRLAPPRSSTTRPATARPEVREAGSQEPGSQEPGSQEAGSQEAGSQEVGESPPEATRTALQRLADRFR